MSAADLLEDALDRVADFDAAGAIALLEAEPHAASDPRVLALLSYARFTTADFAGCRRDAVDALAASTHSDRTTRLLVLGAAGLALGSDRSSGSELEGCFAEADALVDDGGDLEPTLAWLVGYLLVEGAVVNVLIHAARRFADAFADDIAATPGRLYRTLVDGVLARLLLNEGRVADAEAAALAMFERAGSGPTALYAEAVQCLVAGNRAEQGATRTLARRVRQAIPEPTGAFQTTCYLLVGYGLAALADDHGAAALARSASGNDFSGLSVQDRALAIELLVSSAFLDRDIVESERLIGFIAADVDRRVPGPAILRMQCKLELLRGRPAEALALARTATTRALVDGRMLEAGIGEILATRALIAMSDRTRAVRELAALAEQAVLGGHTAATRSAARELKAIGRRLAPVAGSGWDGLSPREREVALLSAEGNSTAEIASVLQLSSRTVDAHVTRVLAAFGIVSRRQLPSRLPATLPLTAVPVPTAPLTPRQRDLTELVADGLSNDEIATALGISRKTVEKHLSAVFQAWGVRSRVAVARIVLANRDR
ncbi:LuxR C-terminal-related transcriptional regulator [Plantibacter sp. CFBP 13570]|uniref:LuxR C-terminal-related transcriptional regulator n=1 Tax=Plantibacter sp. CFBP 13570 TaxID=2775272 RepID=UPI001930A9CC|nr:LuxR C-terminal-related transcriptional regulator [Plantibacter sp. CFBP 13570]MBD8533815.1 response regulator transcription factor [Plantibacter sp. CFBP 13570]